MKWIGRVWTRIQRRRRIKAAKAAKSPLREFVYLDEVSVYSLLTSRKGPLATEYTDTQESSLSGELASSLGANVGVAKANSSSKFAATQTQSTQVLRKSTIQAAFKELHEGEEGKLAISPMLFQVVPPKIATWEELENLAGSSVLGEQWVIDPSTLTRGQLFEMAVELEADTVFRMTEIISAIKNIVQENRELFPASVYLDIQKIEAINRVLDSLLVGLIPLRCRAVDYQVVELKSRKLLVHNRLLAQMPNSSHYKTEALYIVGVTEQRLFWKDVRRVLFSGLQFHMMCRANRNGLQDTWVPVKLFDVLRDIIPDLAVQIDDMSRAAFDAERITASQDSDIADRMRDALTHYGLSLAEQLGGQVDRTDLLEVATKLQYAPADYNDLEIRRDAFSAITDYVTGKLGNDAIDPMIAAQLRTNAMIELGMALGANTRFQGASSSHVTIDREAGSILDTEIVAIYW